MQIKIASIVTHLAHLALALNSQNASLVTLFKGMSCLLQMNAKNSNAQKDIGCLELSACPALPIASNAQMKLPVTNVKVPFLSVRAIVKLVKAKLGICQVSQIIVSRSVEIHSF